MSSRRKTDRSREAQREEISAGAQEAVRESDPVRERFNQMRDIARESRVLTFGNSRFYDKRIQQENSRLFYRQGMFMKDFEDDCGKSLPYSAYFPNYQMMGYGQLRTYFTWRTQVRQGNIQQTSTSYAFLYIYELLNNIGVEGPEDGLERLMLFWDAYRVYDASLDKYVVKWLKDYHIYYELPRSFREFIRENGLETYYPKLADPEDKFDLYCAISKYDIRKSNFYTEENRALVQDCFYFTMDRLRKAFSGCHADLEEYIFQPTRSMAAWTPFQGALFYPAARQADRRVVLSEKEVYLCSQNRWTFSAMITTESGKRLLGYCLKQMESVLRRLTKYKHKLTANPDALSPVMADELRKDGISLEETVTAAVEEFYREATKTVVRVDSAALERIRREALATQERLIVPEEEPVRAGGLQGGRRIGSFGQDGPGDSPRTGDAASGTDWPAPEEEHRLSEFQKAESGIGAGRHLEQWGKRSRGTSESSVICGLEIPRVYELDGEGKRGADIGAGGAVPTMGSVADMAAGAGPKAETVQGGKGLSRTTDGLAEDLGTGTAIGGEAHGHMVPGETAASLGEADSDPWELLKAALSETERQALALSLEGCTDLKPFADRQGIMLEVLVDGINEKAMDFIGDSLLDDEFMIYEDYAEQARGMVESV